MPAARYVKLSEAEDAALLEVERNAGFSDKGCYNSRSPLLDALNAALGLLGAVKMSQT